MALTGKTIGQLTYLSGVTSDTLFPVELSGDTYQLAYSALTNSNYNESTYQELYDSTRNGTLTAGSFYLMTDFQTCYDQPNYDSVGTPITTGNYKTGTTEPILLLAISSTKFSPIVYSTVNPQDKISYDISWNTTEVTNSPAKGRITERIDDKDNRADYDFRAVQFIRYVGYFSERYFPGKINLNSTTGQVLATVTGTTTFQSSFTIGDILGVYYPGQSAPISCFIYYEISSIVSDSEMYVTGRTLQGINNTYFSAGQRLFDYMSPYQCNITGTTNDESAEYYTFNDGENFNTYLGDNTNWNTFILSNNVFQSGSYNNNTFGGNVVGNTFNDDMDSNIIGPLCQYNIITNDFDRNNIGTHFQFNIIECDMESNQIGNYFQNNMLGDDDGQDFDFNRIGSRFTSNFLTFSNNEFVNNDIGFSFNDNIIDSGFRENVITGNFYQNLIRNQDFNDNIVGYNFYGNNIPVTFNGNKISEDFYNNNVWSIFLENDFGQNTYNNSFGDSNSISTYTFSNNSIGGDCNNNYFSGNTEFNTIGDNCNTNTIVGDFRKNIINYDLQGNSINIGGGSIFENNQIMSTFKGNSILGTFTDNQIKTDFKGNELFAEFRYNNVGQNFFSNTLSGTTVHNNIGDDFEFNVLRGAFSFNTIGTNFGSNNIQDGFGVGAGGSYYMGNRIGNNFVENTVGNYFGNNTIADNFADNSLGSDFQWNIVDTNINSIDFTTNYGNIFGITYSSVGTALTNGVYTNVAGSTTGTGVNATFDVTVSGGTVTGVTINDEGRLYFTGDTITILGTDVGGVTGQISTFTVGGLGTLTGTTGTYNGIFALGGSGENAQFDVTVVSDLVDVVTLNFPFGSGYRVGDVLTIPGNTFGSTEAMSITVDTIYSDDVIVTVTSVSQPPSVYESYTCNIFKNSALTNRLSYYDNSDVLTIKNINE